MIRILSDRLVLKDANMETDKENNKFIINLTFRKNGKDIKHSFEYHNYDEAMNDLILLCNSIKNK